jgi:hypothetical protein
MKIERLIELFDKTGNEFNMKTLNELIELFEQTGNVFAKIKLQHLKNELLALTKTLPNDYELGAEVRKLLRDEK